MILGEGSSARQIHPGRCVRFHPATAPSPHRIPSPVTSRQLALVALAIAVAVQAAAVLTLGPLSDWCFCALTRIDPPPTPPPYVLRFVRLAFAPDDWVPRGMGLPLALGFNLVVWFLAMLALLHGMALAARVRIRPLRGDAPGGRRMGLARREAVRPRHLWTIGVVLIAMALGAGAAYRRWWLAEAERVFAAAMAAASAGRPLPTGVRFAMYERRVGGSWPADPEPAYAATADPHQSGDHPLDAFVAPYTYGGTLRFASGAEYEFGVEREKDGWTVSLYPLARRRR
jgi:hypothetical protein